MEQLPKLKATKNICMVKDGSHGILKMQINHFLWLKGASDNLEFLLSPNQLIFSKIPRRSKEHIYHNMIQIDLRAHAPLDEIQKC
jgi:hypothetical protein